MAGDEDSQGCRGLLELTIGRLQRPSLVGMPVDVSVRRSPFAGEGGEQLGLAASLDRLPVSFAGCFWARSSWKDGSEEVMVASDRASLLAAECCRAVYSCCVVMEGAGARIER